MKKKIILLVLQWLPVFSVLPGCDLIPIRKQNVDKERVKRLIEYKSSLFKCYDKNKTNFINFTFEFKISKDGPLSSYGMLIKDEQRGEDTFKVIEPDSNKAEVDCVINILKDIRFKLTDYRKSEEYVRVTF